MLSDEKFLSDDFDVWRIFKSIYIQLLKAWVFVQHVSAEEPILWNLQNYAHKMWLKVKYPAR